MNPDFLETAQQRAEEVIRLVKEEDAEESKGPIQPGGEYPLTSKNEGALGKICQQASDDDGLTELLRALVRNCT